MAIFQYVRYTISHHTFSPQGFVLIYNYCVMHLCLHVSVTTDHGYLAVAVCVDVINAVQISLRISPVTFYTLIVHKTIVGNSGVHFLVNLFTVFRS